MANFNKVMLIGRLTRDPETRTFASGGKVAKIGFAVTNRKRNSQTGQWEDEPMFIDVDVFNRGEFGKLADLVQDRCRKGSQILIEGSLHLDQWEDKSGGGKRSKHKIVADSIQLLDARSDGQGGGGGGGMGGGGGGARSGGNYSSGPAPTHPDDDDGGSGHSGGGGSGDGDIPF
ncbi:MAG: single-stranded DNA-binding protein [Gemmataceae bacterium]